MKRIVNTHSRALNRGRHWSRIDCTLSRITTSTLITITAISVRSNHRPAGVSASKITVNSVRRQPRAGLSNRESVAAGVDRASMFGRIRRVMRGIVRGPGRLIQLRLLRNEVPHAVSAFLR
ncbi:hypothetical protein D9M68_964480 [compost metagenome]